MTKSTAEAYNEELKEVINKQLELIKNDSSIDDKAENTIRFNEISQKIIDDKDIDASKRAVMLAAISVYTNIFVDSIRRDKTAEEMTLDLEKIAFSYDIKHSKGGKAVSTTKVVATTEVEYEDEVNQKKK